MRNERSIVEFEVPLVQALFGRAARRAQLASRPTKALPARPRKLRERVEDNGAGRTATI